MPALDFTALTAALEEDASVNSSAETLITQLLADIESHKNDPVQLQAIVDQYRAQTATLAAAVAAGTPAAPDSAKRKK
jgi:hypothetical protein